MARFSVVCNRVYMDGLNGRPLDRLDEFTTAQQLKLVKEWERGKTRASLELKLNNEFARLGIDTPTLIIQAETYARAGRSLPPHMERHLKISDVAVARITAAYTHALN